MPNIRIGQTSLRLNNYLLVTKFFSKKILNIILLPLLLGLQQTYFFKFFYFSPPVLTLFNS